MTYKFTIMQRILLFMGCFLGGLALNAQNDGIIQFWTSLDCAEYQDVPFIDPANITGMNLRIADPALGVTFGDRTTYATFPMTLDVADNFWKIDHTLNGGAGNAEFRWYFEVVYNDPDNGGASTVAVEGINNDFPIMGEYPIMDAQIGFANGAVRRNPFSAGNTNRRIFTSLGGVFYCNGSETTIEIDMSTADPDVLATLNANGPLFVPNNNWGKFLPGGGFSRYTMTQSSTDPNVYGIRMPMLRSNFFQYNLATNFPPTGVAEGGIMAPYLSARTCAVEPWGARTAFTEENTNIFDSWGTPNDGLPAGAVNDFAASGTVTAEVAFEAADGYTYYTSDGRLLLGVDWRGETPAAAADVSVTFGGNQATFFADGTGFISNGVGAAIMGRTWDVNATISSAVGVRFFYTQADIDAVNAAIGGTPITQSQLQFYKVLSGEDPLAIADLAPEDVQIYSSGAAAPGSLASAAGEDTECASILYSDFDVTSFSGGGGGGVDMGGNFLPVELAMLTAEDEKKNVMVKWATASESGNEGFEVEHSTNGVDFRSIGHVAGAGTSTAYRNYDFEHVDAPTGVNFYRLKQMDLTGASTLSHIVSAVVEGGAAFSVYPNPATNEIFVDGKDLDGSVSIRDAQGRTINTNVLVGERGRLDISELTPGLYFATVRNGDETETLRFVKR